MAGTDVPSGGNGEKKASRIGIHIDMTPMVDVIILLLIFFFMTSQFKEPHGIEITLPKGESKVKVPISNTVTLKVDENDNISINDEPVNDLKEIRSYLIERQSTNPNLITIVKVHPQATYGTMINVLDEFKISSEETGVTKFSLDLSPGETEEVTEGGGS